MGRSLHVDCHEVLAADSPYTVHVVYNGDSNYVTSSTSPDLSVTVNTDATTTSVTSSANPSVSGQSVIFTATVAADSPGSGIPTGTATLHHHPDRRRIGDLHQHQQPDPV